jgi:TolA-binding protein
MNLKFTNHKESKNEKKQIWMYALILFTGAFIVLLLTAYSQVKFQNNISEYQNKLSSQEKAKINAVTDFNSAIKENKRLKTEIEALRNKLVNSEQKLAGEEEKSAELESKYSNAVSASDFLMKAQTYYIKEDYLDCAATLKYSINTSYLSADALKLYNDLAGDSFGKASKLLYREGYNKYKKKNYAEAIVSLTRAIDFSNKNEYYIDDAYYYIANSYYKSSNYVEAKKTIDSFLVNYPKSSFVGDMKALSKRMETDIFAQKP